MVVGPSLILSLALLPPCPSLILSLTLLATLVMAATTHRPLYTIPDLTEGKTNNNKPPKSKEAKVNVETNTNNTKNTKNSKKSTTEEKFAATMPMAEEMVVEMETKTTEPKAASIYPSMSSIVG